jgi:hypothetical protein
MIVICALRITAASMELAFDLKKRSWRTHGDISILDNMCFPVIVGMLVSQYFHHVWHTAGPPVRPEELDHISSSEPKPEYMLVPGEEPHPIFKKPLYLRDWRFAAIIGFLAPALPLYTAGCVVAMGLNRVGSPEVLEAGAVVLGVVGFLLLWCFTLPSDKRSRIRSKTNWFLFFSAGTVRFVWSLVSPWYLLDQQSLFNPLRATRASTFAHLGMVTMMEFLLVVLCFWFPRSTDKKPDDQAERENS